MSYIPFIPERQKDETGIFHCENCGMILTYKAHYCDNCNSKRTEKTKMLIKKYWWIII